MASAGTVRTARLELVCADVHSARAAAGDAAALAALLAAEVPPTWPPEHMDDAMNWLVSLYERDPAVGGWAMWFVVLDGDEGGGGAPGRVLIGSVGFKGRPGEIGGPGSVEIGYSIVNDRQRRGYASEAVAAMLGWAFSHVEVSRVTAHTLERHVPSLGVLRKNGFTYVGLGTEQVDETERQGRGDVVLYELPRRVWEQRVGVAGPGANNPA